MNKRRTDRDGRIGRDGGDGKAGRDSRDVSYGKKGNETLKPFAFICIAGGDDTLKIQHIILSEEDTIDDVTDYVLTLVGAKKTELGQEPPLFRCPVHTYSLKTKNGVLPSNCADKEPENGLLYNSNRKDNRKCARSESLTPQAHGSLSRREFASRYRVLRSQAQNHSE
jgi:hypothetical protein